MNKTPTNQKEKWVLPVNRSKLAIAAGYLAFFALLIFPAPIALVVGILALRDIKKHPGEWGKGRAWFGIVLGALGTLVLINMTINQFKP